MERRSRLGRAVRAVSALALLAGLTVVTPWATNTASADTPVTLQCGIAENQTTPTGTAVPGCSVTISNRTAIDTGTVVTVSWTGADTTQDIGLVVCGVPNAFPGGTGGPCDTRQVVRTQAQNLAEGGTGSATITLHTGGTGASNGGGCPDPNTADNQVCALRFHQSASATYATDTSFRIEYNRTAPVAGTTNLAVGGNNTGSPATLATSHEPGSCFLDAGATQTTGTFGTGGRLSVTISNSPTKCQATFVDSGSTNEDVAVPFWSKDAVNLVSTSSATQTVHLAALPPTALNGSANVTAGGSSVTATLGSTAGSLPVAGCFLDAAGTQTTGTYGTGGRTSVAISNSPTKCVATIGDTGTGSATVSVPFWAKDTGGNVSAASATETVNVQGVQPVNQPLDVTVNPGVLSLSCAAGSVSLVCPTVHLTPVTLDGQAHTATGAASSIYVTDARGADQTWSLQVQMVASPSSGGACTGAIELCNSTYAGANGSSSHNHLGAGSLSIGSVSCSTVTGSNPAPTAHAGGSLATTQVLCDALAGSNSGQFKMDASYSLSVPADLFAGLFTGSLLYTVS